MYKLTEEGQDYLKNGLPEKQLLIFLGEGKPMAEVAKFPKSLIAVGWARKNGWIKIESGVAKPTEEGFKALNDRNETERSLENVDKNQIIEGEVIRTMMNRNLIVESKETSVPVIQEIHPSIWQRIISIFHKKNIQSSVSISSSKSQSIGDIAQLTPEMLKTGEWKSRNFRKYDVTTPAPTFYPGKKQPYIQFLEEIREKLVGMGFQEMKGPMVEESFWNADSLFTPQDHSSKDIHDIFYMKNPTTGVLPDENLVAKVKATHEGGWITESTGWGGSWSRDEASKLIMRSHTTAVSARTLFKYGDVPGKYFTIDRVFRPDVIDASHLMEFQQCEGIVVGEDLTFKHLLGFFKEIANSIGVKDIKFQPAYFPFTEPSVQCMIKHPKLGWIETMPGGVFRPELLKPLGIEKSNVLAWGIGISRLAMIALGIDDIRMLFSDDLEWLRKTPLGK
jgi:phenylalanyl-tRNA synthetase alpha chain